MCYNVLMKKKCALVLTSLLFAVSCSSGFSSSDSTLSSSQTNSFESYRSAADKAHYDFDPTTIKSPELCVEENGTYRAMNLEEVREKANTAPSYEELTDANGNRHNIFAQFQGYYAEGYNGVYDVTQAKIRLFDNGTFSLSEDSNLKFKNGCWFDCEFTKRDGSIGQGIKLAYIEKNKLVTYTSEEDDQFDFRIMLPLNYSGLARTITMLGYYYYPTIGLYVEDNGHNVYTINKGMNASNIIEDIRRYWEEYVVLSNLKAYPIFHIKRFYFEDDEVEYSISNCNTEGVKTVVARYENFYCTKEIMVYTA